MAGIASGLTPRTRRILLWLFVAVIAGLAGLDWYVSTNAFQSMVRRRIVAEIAKITGGRVEVASVHAIPFRLRAEVRGLDIYGREANGPPFLHVDSVSTQIKIVSALGAEIAFNSIDLDHPVLHIVTYPDGTTNQPQPTMPSHGGAIPIDRLFNLSINQLSVGRGEVDWNERKTPLDFAASDLNLELVYSFLHERYDGTLAVGKIDSTLPGMRPFSSSLKSVFRLRANELSVQTLRLDTGGTHLEASGAILNFAKPKIDASYNAGVSLAELAAIVRQPEVRRGTAILKGNAEWTSAGLVTKGKLYIRDVDWQHNAAGLRNVALATDYSISPKSWELTQLQGVGFGGSVTGEARGVGLPMVGPGPNATAKDVRGYVRLNAKEVSLSDILAFFSNSAHPVNQLDLAGSGSGLVEWKWTRSLDDSEIMIAADVSPPSRPTTLLPVTAHGSVVYKARNDELQVLGFNGALPHTQASASGSLSSDSRLKFTAATTSLDEIRPILDLLGVPDPLPVTLHGDAEMTGSVTGRVTAASVEGLIQANDVDAHFNTPKGHAVRTHFDTASAQIRASQNMFSATDAKLVRPAGEIDFTLSLPLRKGRIDRAAPFQLKAHVEGEDVQELLAAVDQTQPLTGTLRGEFEAAGTIAEPEASGSVEITDATVYEQPLDSLRSKFDFKERMLDLTNFEARQKEATLRGDSTIDVHKREARGHIDAAHISLSQIDGIQTPDFPLEGLINLKADFSGPIAAPAIQAHAQVSSIMVAHESMGDLQFDAVTKGNRIQVESRSDFARGKLELAGYIEPAGELASTFSLKFTDFNIHPMIQAALPGRLTGSSPVSGAMTITGPLRYPRFMAVKAELDGFHADVGKIAVASEGPIQFGVLHQKLAVERLHLVGNQTDLSADGTVQLDGNHELNLHAEGSANLKLIESYNEDFNSSGALKMSMVVSGLAAQPELQGRLEIHDGSLAYINAPSALSNLEGTILFGRNRAEIEKLTARTGGGTVNFHGYAVAHPHDVDFDLGMTGQSVRLRYPPGISSTADFELRFAGNKSASTISGDVAVNKLGMTPGFDFGAYLERTAQASSLPPTNPWLNRIRLDVHAVTAPELQMQTAVVRLSGDADLRLRGTAGKPVILGRADVIEGEAYFNGTKYRLERGDITFTSPVTTTPVLDLQATTRVRDYDVTLNLNGEADKLNIIYRSEPPLPTADIIALLAFGQTTEESAQLQQTSQSAFTSAASNAILSEALNAAVSNRAQRIFGVSHIRIDPQGLATETSPTQNGPAVTIEQQVKNDLTITYTTLVSQASQQIIQGEYNLSRNVSIVGLRDQNGVVSFAVRIRRRKR